MDGGKAQTPGQPGRAVPTRHWNTDGFQVHALDDGVDYWDLIARFRKGRVVGELKKERKNYRVYIIEDQGRRYVLKHDSKVPHHWEVVASRLFLGPLYSRIMRKTNRAVANGCDFIQRVFLVAERVKMRLARESIILFEYIPGPTLDSTGDAMSHRQEIVDAIAALHRYKLAFVDTHPGNFIVTDDGLKIIDLSFRNSFLVGRAKDVISVKELYNVDMPVKGFLNRLMVRAVWWNRYVRHHVRRLTNDRKVGEIRLNKRPR